MVESNNDIGNMISKVEGKRNLLCSESFSKRNLSMLLFKQNGSATICISCYFPTCHCRKLYLSLFTLFHLFAVLTFGLMGCADVNSPTELQKNESIGQTNGKISSESRYLQIVLNANLEERKRMLRYGHQKFLNLPVKKQHVFNEILPKIQENRAQPFPDFPERGGTSEEAKIRVDDWLTNHPERLASYLDFLDEQYKQFDRSFQQ